ncbi:hypothetical protein SOASR030_07440 [Leminorella grimontii]|uniref:N-acetyltransferase domain-containing protein n=1 Tax=Leminorella grimontii TaxID=82981 RepID=A0AAV5N2G2_9GAMM|nr:GNAT family N-acetyltransferase [Leminorella grimontii]KFC96180.1 GNAT family acetyltransferase [Leminorella grimontii ATCC 33999 = DSM 5078]GKX54632.1 hypothetical protein SOASR030_07440 [Leminorella grimontii]VFS58785.1 ribosomal-protein-alanine acetyltransferase [Leminorella grimontii]
MNVILVKTEPDDVWLAESLSQYNTADYYAKYGISWKTHLFTTNWEMRENYRVVYDDTHVGFLMLEAEPESGELYIHDLQLDKAYQRRGIGSQVLTLIERLARQREIQHLRLSVFIDSPAQALYGSRGFVVVNQNESRVSLYKRL